MVSIRDIASDHRTWLNTQGTSGFRKTSHHPIEDTNWATVATKFAMTWTHVDDDGLATSTQILTGKKYWIVLYRDPALPTEDHRGDMGKTDFLPSIDSCQTQDFTGWMTTEAIELVPLCVL